MTISGIQFVIRIHRRGVAAASVECQTDITTTTTTTTPSVTYSVAHQWRHRSRDAPTSRFPRQSARKRQVTFTTQLNPTVFSDKQ